MRISPCHTHTLPLGNSPKKVPSIFFLFCFNWWNQLNQRLHSGKSLAGFSQCWYNASSPSSEWHLTPTFFKYDAMGCIPLYGDVNDALHTVWLLVYPESPKFITSRWTGNYTTTWEAWRTWVYRACFNAFICWHKSLSEQEVCLSKCCCQIHGVT